MLRYTGPLLTRDTALVLLAARERGEARWAGSLDLGLTQGEALLEDDGWRWHGIAYPYPGKLKDRTLYWWDGEDFAPVSRYAGSLIKLVPTEWGVPTFEIDGIKMLPTSRESPLDDAQRKVALVEPRGKVVLDTCGGLGYFAACCLAAGATRIRSFEKNGADVSQAIGDVVDASIDAVLHDPPRFGIAGELYSQAFYDQLARVLRRGGRLFHYTGSPNRLTSGRDVPGEVAKRLEKAGFRAQRALDGVVGLRR